MLNGMYHYNITQWVKGKSIDAEGVTLYRNSNTSKQMCTEHLFKVTSTFFIIPFRPGWLLNMKYTCWSQNVVCLGYYSCATAL